MFPLHYAIEHMDHDTAKSLLEHGVDVDLRDADFGLVTALHLAVDIECEDACRRYDEGNKDAVPMSILTRLLLDFGADPTIKDSNGKTPHDWASERHHVEAVKLFEAFKKHC